MQQAPVFLNIIYVGYKHACPGHYYTNWLAFAIWVIVTRFEILTGLR